MKLLSPNRYYRINSRHCFDLYPEFHNSSSIIWWFILLFPKQQGSYGPSQLMLSFMSFIGDVNINNSRVENASIQYGNYKNYKLNTYLKSWYYSNGELNRNFISETGMAQLNQYKNISMWNWYDKKQKGAEIRVNGNDDLVVTGVGSDTEIDIDVWDKGVKTGRLNEISVAGNKIWNYNILVWNDAKFTGNIKSNGTSKNFEGRAYFQKAEMNFPLIPWVWNRVIFANGYLFSSLIPYLSWQIFTRKHIYFNNPKKFRKIEIGSTANFYDETTKINTIFTDISFTPMISKSGRKMILISCRNNNNDYIKLVFTAYEEMNFEFKRKKLFNVVFSYDYNELLVKVTKLNGKIAGKLIDITKTGIGFGNCEYSFGLGF